MPEDLIIARNPEPDSSLPYLIRIPLGANGLVVKSRDTWPRATKVYCHRAAEWPAEPEILERLPVRSAARRGAAIDLVLTRARENRSQFVLTQARGREMIFWQTARTAKQARPRVNLPTARAHGEQLVIIVDSAEKYAYGFRHQQATTTRMRLAAGDYAVALDDQIVAAVVVEAGYSKIFNRPFSSGAAVAEALAEAEARFPQVPVMFCENRAMAQEWTFRWLGACLQELQIVHATAGIEQTFVDGTITQPPSPAAPSAAQIRRWARDQGIGVPDTGRIPVAVRQAFADR